MIWGDFSHLVEKKIEKDTGRLPFLFSSFLVLDCRRQAENSTLGAGRSSGRFVALLSRFIPGR